MGAVTPSWNPLPTAGHTAQTLHVSEAQRAMKEMPKTGIEQMQSQKENIIDLTNRRPTAWYLQTSQLAGTAKLKGPEATSWLHSESLLLLALSYRLLEKKFLFPLVKWQDTGTGSAVRPIAHLRMVSVWSWLHFSTFLKLSFFIYKMRIQVLPSRLL